MTATALTAPATVVRRAPSRLGILVRQAIAEIKGQIRAPDFAVGVIALPVVLYMVFGAP